MPTAATRTTDVIARPSPAQADAWAATVVAAVTRPYPWAAQHTVTGPDDVDVTPTRLHPAFHGSYDWHSCVHMLWSGLTLLGLPGEPLDADAAAALSALLDERLTPDNVAAEAALLARRPSFERPYGWAWALQLTAAAATSPHPHAPRWSAALAPLERVLSERFASWLPGLPLPVRVGTHQNTAFALALTRDAAVDLGRTDLITAVDAAARGWFGDDRGYPISWEPGGHDFLSAGLSEAVLMARVLGPDAAAAWLSDFLPGLGREGDPIFDVPVGGDATDGQLAHLLGLALSRAWHLRELAPLLDADAAARIAATTPGQIERVAAAITEGDFMATHWLVSFALKAQLAG